MLKTVETLRPVVGDNGTTVTVEFRRKLQLPPPVPLSPRPPRDRFPPPKVFTFTTEPQ
jgi:hypothetical protein